MSSERLAPCAHVPPWHACNTRHPMHTWCPAPLAAPLPQGLVFTDFVRMLKCGSEDCLDIYDQRRGSLGGGSSSIDRINRLLHASASSSSLADASRHGGCCRSRAGPRTTAATACSHRHSMFLKVTRPCALHTLVPFRASVPFHAKCHCLPLCHAAFLTPLQTLCRSHPALMPLNAPARLHAGC